MAHLDRFLAALVTNRATALVMHEGMVAELEISGSARPITKQAFSEAQLRTLLREVAPVNVAAALDAGQDASFEYACADGVFVVAIVRAQGKLIARVVLDDGTRRPTPAKGVPAPTLHAAPAPLDQSA